jgi:hypothetical protein
MKLPTLMYYWKQILSAQKSPCPFQTYNDHGFDFGIVPNLSKVENVGWHEPIFSTAYVKLSFPNLSLPKRSIWSLPIVTDKGTAYMTAETVKGKTIYKKQNFPSNYLTNRYLIKDIDWWCVNCLKTLSGNFPWASKHIV